MLYIVCVFESAVCTGDPVSTLLLLGQTSLFSI